MKAFQSIYLFIILLMLPVSVGAQDFAVKTNLLYDATATINLGVEFPVAKRLTLDISGNFNGWDWKDNMKWKHWMVQPELRLWTCNRFAGHFFALHAIAGQYNIGNISNSIDFLGTPLKNLSHNRYEGWAAGGGIGYGYALPLSRHLNLEFEVGAGVIWTRYDSFDCDICNRKNAERQDHLYWGPTKLALGIVYLF